MRALNNSGLFILVNNFSCVNNFIFLHTNLNNGGVAHPDSYRELERRIHICQLADSSSKE
jgi:hypothetical protein